MDLGKKIFILAPSREEVVAIHKQLEALNPSFKIESDTVAVRGLVRIVGWQPDLLIIGVDLGTVTGFDLVEILRMIPPCAFMSIIVMISREHEMLSSKAIRSGADLYVPKDGQMIESIQKGIRKLLLEPDEAMQLEKRPINKVLVVDDSRTMRRIITTILAGIGIREIIEAEDGIDGIKKLSTENADMVVADYAMAGMNGLEMVKQIRKIEHFDKLPIVIATAEGPDVVDGVLRAGANGYINKPFTMQHLRDVIATFASNVR